MMVITLNAIYGGSAVRVWNPVPVPSGYFLRALSLLVPVPRFVSIVGVVPVPPTVPYRKARYQKTVIKYPHIVLKVTGVAAGNNKTNPTAADVDRTGLGCVLESVDIDAY